MSLRKCNKHWQVREAVLAFILWYQWIYKELQYCKNHEIQLHIFSAGVITVPFWGCERAKGRFGEQLLLWGFASCSNTWKLSLPLIIAMFWCCLERLYIVFVIFHVCYCTSAFYLIFFFFSLNLTCQGNVQLLTCSWTAVIQRKVLWADLEQNCRNRRKSVKRKAEMLLLSVSVPRLPLQW